MTKILIVDDEAANLRALERLFRGDFNVLTAQSGDDALALLEQHDVALLITHNLAMVNHRLRERLKEINQLATEDEQLHEKPEAGLNTSVRGNEQLNLIASN